MFRTFALTGFAALIAASVFAVAPPAQAQIGNIFSDPPLRPPGSIPRGQQQQLPPDDDEQVPELPRGRLLPSRPAPGQGVPPPGAVQSQPLAPPPEAWAMQHPVAYTLIWVGVILAVFVPLSIRLYRRAANR